MAKLNKTMAKKVDDADDSGFEPLEEGVYHFRLRDVDPTKEGPKGPYWVWEFECVEEPYINRRLWNNTSLSEAAMPIFKRTFKAFDVPVDTDTDELLGRLVRLVVSQRTIPEGPRQGEVTNQVNRVLPPDPDFRVPEAAGATSGDKIDIF